MTSHEPKNCAFCLSSSLSTGKCNDYFREPIKYNGVGGTIKKENQIKFNNFQQVG